MSGSPSSPGKPRETPRPYLSWSQLDCFERDPEKYVRRYFYGETDDSPALRFGKEIADGLTADEPPTEDVEHLQTFIRPYEFREHEITAEYAGIPLLVRMDLFSRNPLEVGEIKTGRTRWDQRRADSHGQIDFYDVALWLTFREIPANTLYWAPTEIVNGVVRLTGEVHAFKTERTLRDLARMGGRIQRAWEGIKKVTKEHQHQLT